MFIKNNQNAFNFTGYVYVSSRSSIHPFIAEISNPKIRGFTLSLWPVCTTLGHALTIVVSDLVGWRYVALFLAVLMIFCLLGLMWLHETPDWLLERKIFDKALASLKFYQTPIPTIDGEQIDDYDCLIELYKLEARMKNEQNQEAPVSNTENIDNNTWM